MKQKNKAKGITLIALVITIIVLLILAGVGFTTLIGENSVLTKASKAKEENLIEQYKEEINLIIIDEVAERKTQNKDELMIVSLDSKIREKEWVNKIYKCNSSGEEQSTFEASTHLLAESKEHYEFLIEVNEANQTAKIVSSQKGTEEKCTITYHPNGGDGQEETIKVRQGSSITIKNCNYTREEYKFVGWCENQTGEGKRFLENDSYKPEGEVILYAIWESLIVPGEIITGGNKKYNNNGTAIIPEGFAIVPGCNDVSKGLVISDNAEDTEIDRNHIVANGNQFVWIPVTNIQNFKAIEGYDTSGNLQDRLKNRSEPYASGYNTEKTDYNTMKQRVKENQGFYIGRYEAGKDTEENVVVKKNTPVYNSIGWSNSDDMTNELGGAVELSKNFTKGKSYQGKVTSTLVYGVQWDATMQFFDSNYLTSNCAESSYIRNSSGKGNYKSDKLINTGSNENYKEKNIYDMAGNAIEWTMEAYSANNKNYRVIRGGNCSTTSSVVPASFRGYNSPSYAYIYFGFRIALYV